MTPHRNSPELELRVARAVERVRSDMDRERDRVPRHKREPWIKSYLPRQRIAMARKAIEVVMASLEKKP